MKRLILTTLILFLMLGSVYADDLKGGLDAVNRGDYETAFEKFKPLAEQGNAKAQYSLGLMYSDGLGVVQDYKEAVKWFRLSAEQGDNDAQYNLGQMYDQGLGVPQDYVLAHMWFNLASINGNKDAVKNRNIVEKKMSKQQIDKAQEMARNWKPTTK